VSIALNLLADVRWRGRTVVGDRPRALLAALGARGGRVVPAEDLIELVWGDEAPLNGLKSLQVLVSRARTACGAEAIVTAGAGYRLGAAPDEVDSARVSALVRAAAGALDRDAAAAAALGSEALELTAGLPGVGDGEAGPLAEVRRASAADAASARVILARASSRTGAHADAFPALAAAHAERPHDEPLLADLLRSEAAVRGPAVALERLELYRRDLRERLGADPGEALKRVHRGLLALDRPVRRGVRYDATTLIGRDGDLERLRALLEVARVVSVVGPGGLGKTRLAQAIARTAAEPAVHVVELAGVTSAEDVAGEVGAALGVRDSVSGRRVLTAAQRADMRARIAQLLGQAPGLLVLDNCEHLIEAVASLVAFLVSVTADLRVLTTSRAPLAIAAERVYLLGELGAGDAVRLFRERAVAARPSVQLTEPHVTSIVGQLDGLPLAIELAAARVRTMALEEIDRRLADRFALLRGGDRSAPGRHQTLFAVIDWSWNLLNAAERRALPRLALFHDGFTLEAAEAVLGDDAVEAVQGLVDQSLLSVSESPAGGRYRMLETVREFGQLRLAEAGEEAAARAAQRRWAAAYAHRHGVMIPSRDQFAAIDAIGAEEVNLADELRGAITDGDRNSLVQLLSALGLFWTVRGAHARIIVLAAAVADALRDWQPPPDLVDDACGAVMITLSNSLMTGAENVGQLRAILARLSQEEDRPYQSGLMRVLLAYDPADPDVGAFVGRIERLAGSQDRRAALAASQWLCYLRENAGDAVGAITEAKRTLALSRDEDGPWSAAMPRTMLAQLTMHVGNRAAAVEHAQAALPVMRRLGASDDESQLRSLLALCAIADGRLADAKEEVSQMESVPDTGLFGGGAMRLVCHAELALASGDHAAGLRMHREAAARMRAMRLPGVVLTGLEPWVLFGESVALSAHARYATGSDEAHGRALFLSCRESAVRLLAAPGPQLDYPATGQLLFALGVWALLRRPVPGESRPGDPVPGDPVPGDSGEQPAGEAGPAGVALRLLALANRFGYNRTMPTMMWEHIAAAAEEAAPGQLAEFQARYRDSKPPDLLTQARRLAERLPG
jgi:predicted ATPase/DNA-binding SARP family transcriptional activator